MIQQRQIDYYQQELTRREDDEKQLMNLQAEQQAEQEEDSPPVEVGLGVVTPITTKRKATKTRTRARGRVQPAGVAIQTVGAAEYAQHNPVMPAIESREKRPR